MSPDKKSTYTENAAGGFSKEEKAAMKERALELKAEAKMNKSREEGEKALVAKIEEMPEPDRSMARRVHEIIISAAPELAPKTWYSMPAYAKAGKVVCFFQSGKKFESRYCTLGFSDSAALDDGSMWPSSFALNALNSDTEARITALVKKAVG